MKKQVSTPAQVGYTPCLTGIHVGSNLVVRQRRNRDVVVEDAAAGAVDIFPVAAYPDLAAAYENAAAGQPLVFLAIEVTAALIKRYGAADNV